MLAQRQKQRLSEADSSLAKRLAWAKQQVAKSSAAGLFDDIIPNTSLAEVRGAWQQLQECALWAFCCNGEQLGV